VSTALQIHDVAPPPAARATVGLLRPVAQPAAVLEAQNEMRGFVAQCLREGTDYGVIPGTERRDGKKVRVLFKPGAERTCMAFDCSIAEPQVVEREVDHFVEIAWQKRKKKWGRNRGEFTWETESGTSVGLYRYVVRVDVVHRPTGLVVASCLGSCSTLESKYIDRPRDSENTVLKMAQKRALVGATLLAFGLSDQFTQDLEDMEDHGTAEVVATRGEQRQRASGARREQRALDIPPEERVWPFKGDQRGKALGEFTDAALQKAILWMNQTDPVKFADLVADARAVLGKRQQAGKGVPAQEARDTASEEMATEADHAGDEPDEVLWSDDGPEEG